MSEYTGPSGEFLLVVATLVSFQLAQGKTADELLLISAFFEVLGDNLALLAATRPVADPAAGISGVVEEHKNSGM